MDSSYLIRAASKCGFNRDVFRDANVPTVRSNIYVFPFFGDMRSELILSSFLLKRYKEQNKHNYVIVCSWKGCEGLFPYVDEYWSLKDASASKLLSSHAENFHNTSDVDSSMTRNLNEFFDNVLSYRKDFKKYYDSGFTNQYWKDFETAKVFLPGVPSGTINPGFVKKIQAVSDKVVLYPEKRIRSWQKGQSQKVLIGQRFWNALVERLIKEDILPIIYQNDFTYDLSKEFAERCGYIVNNSMLHVFSMIREVGCAIDIFSGFSRIAIVSRSPFISVTERQLFLETKEFEIDDLTCAGLPREYIFGFSGQALTGNETDWNKNLFDILIKKIRLLLPSIRMDELPTTVESYQEVPYEIVRERKSRRTGVRFISIGKRASK